MGIQMVGSIGEKSCVTTMSISWCTLLTLYAVIGENCRTNSQSACVLSLKQAIETQNTQVKYNPDIRNAFCM